MCEFEYVLIYLLLYVVEVLGGVLQLFVGMDGMVYGVLGLVYWYLLYDCDYEFIFEIVLCLIIVLENDMLCEQVIDVQYELRQFN